MKTSKITEDGREILVKQCVAVLRQGVDLIENLTDAIYRHGGKRSIGAHFRHNLDFATNFLLSLETGRLDYNARERDSLVEKNRQYAAAKFCEVIEKLENLTSEELIKKILVRSETIENLWCESSAMRELEFLQSHTIHHYALIQTKLAPFGFAVPRDFGVAPSTLEFWKSQTA